ncbi:uncharacterized protein LOC122265152 [Penaeus japonicus]|uniref:uncharacterized protein LOC122265152 n=1 Tax=Penaeus japonicus TaxID=27405 RepID=UPI001C70D813|nr:uncharacterized protein LOC122265152 [Penaeus japonicus]
MPGKKEEEKKGGLRSVLKRQSGVRRNQKINQQKKEEEREEAREIHIQQLQFRGQLPLDRPEAREADQPHDQILHQQPRNEGDAEANQRPSLPRPKGQGNPAGGGNRSPLERAAAAARVRIPAFA